MVKPRIKPRIKPRLHKRTGAPLKRRGGPRIATHFLGKPLTPRNRLRDAREALGLSQRELARRLGSNRLYILNVEVGRKNPRLPAMVKWAAELGVSLDVFIPDQGYDNAAE